MSPNDSPKLQLEALLELLPPDDPVVVELALVIVRRLNALARAAERQPRLTQRA